MWLLNYSIDSKIWLLIFCWCPWNINVNSDSFKSFQELHSDALKHLFVSIALKRASLKQLKIDTQCEKKWVTIVLTYHECIGITGMQEKEMTNEVLKKLCTIWTLILARLISENCECRLYNLHFGGLFYLEKWLY